MSNPGDVHGIQTIASRASNIERAKWRSKCRQKLAEHIRENLGLVVEPTQVRLITTADDLYSWKVLPGKEHLFGKQLSKHSIGAYMELFREVGASFEAVFATGKTTSQDPGSDGSVTFSGKISALTEELDWWKSRAERAERDLEHLNITSKRDLEQLRITVSTLSQQDTNKMALITYYRNVTKSLQEASSAAESLGF